MKYEETSIEALLNRFVKGETTLAEERLLADYFATAQSVPERWRAFAVLFGGIEAGVLAHTEPIRHSPNILAQPASEQSPRRSLKWLKVAGVAAVFCICCLLGRMAWRQETPVADSKEVLATAVKQSLQPADKVSEQPYAAQMTPPATPLLSETPKAPGHNVMGQSRRPLSSERETAKNDGKYLSATAGQGNNAASASDKNHAQLPDNTDEKLPASTVNDYQSDLSEHIVSTLFTYSEDSQLDERAIRVRNRVRGEVLEQYAHIGF
ncbi:MAG: hypothetical protein U0L68_04455 [Prevotellamassilia sp.]|nr:hypothetical protein [Prevotellamassilia sp.]